MTDSTIRYALVLAILALAACSGPRRIAPPRGECFALAFQVPAGQEAGFGRAPGIVEIGERKLAGRGRHEPDAYARARSWPVGWTAASPRSNAIDPIGGWRRVASGRRADSHGQPTMTDSLTLDIGPYALADAGVRVIVKRRDGGLDGRLTVFTDVGPPFQRSTPVVGRSAACPISRAYAELSASY